MVRCQEVGAMGMDQALLHVRYVPGQSASAESGSNVDGEQANTQGPVSDMLSLVTQSIECYKCSMAEACRWNTTESRSIQLLVDTRYGTNLAIRNEGSTQDLCALSEHFGEHGTYNMTIREGDRGLECEIQEVLEPKNGNLPILYVFIVYVVLWLLYYGAVFGRRYWMKRRAVKPDVDQEQTDQNDLLRAPSPEAKITSTVKKARLRSLDAFRGVSIVVMIFVNLGGGGYYFFAHSVWNGLTVADLVFPWFMFIMGTSMYLSISGAIRKQVSIRSVWLNIIRRSIILFLLGLFINGGGGNNDWRTFRIFGVLQRFGITYFIVGSFVCIRFWRTRREGQEPSIDSSIFADIKAVWFEWVLVSVLVLVHTCLTFLLPVPGCPRGYLGPGGTADNGIYANCTGGAAGYIDRVILTQNHTYGWPTCREIYQTTLPYDPEGILGQLTASLTVFIGLQAGVTLVTFSSHRGRLIRWVSWGLVCGIIGGVLCLFSKNDGWIPVNKNLWSLSFVFTMAAMAYISLSALYLVIDVKHWWDGAPFYQAGMNSIVLYMAHECFGDYLPFSWQPVVNPITHAAQLVMNAWATSLFVVLAIYMHYKRIFISI